MKPWRCGLFFVATGMLAAVCFSFLLLPSPERVYAGVTVGGVEVGGRTCEEVRGMLEVWRREQRARAVTLYDKEHSFLLTGEDIDFDIDIDDTLAAVWRCGRSDSWWERLKKSVFTSRKSFFVPLVIRYNEDKLDGFLEKCKEAVERPPRNAAFSLRTGGLVLPAEGRKLEEEQLRPAILAALKNESVDTLSLPVSVVFPAVTAQDVEKTGIREKLAEFSTAFNPQDGNRSRNIELAAEWVNGLIVGDGQVFSFNDVVGPREKKYGFREALELVDGEFVPGIGGGICQVSSTLYNAVLLGGLDIVERHNHGKPLSYVPLGRDATVAFGYLDFRFANYSGGPLLLSTEIDDGNLLVGVFGCRKPSFSIAVLTAEKRLLPPPVNKEPDDTLYLGETRVESQGKPGYEVTTVRVFAQGGHEVRRETLSKDVYAPDPTVVKVGVRLPPFAGQPAY